jgi:hypothetical protein
VLVHSSSMSEQPTPKMGQDAFRNLFFKRPIDDTGLPPPKEHAATAAVPAEEKEIDDQLEDKIEDDLFGDIVASREISPEEARAAAQVRGCKTVASSQLHKEASRSVVSSCLLPSRGSVAAAGTSTP